jgi:hypothetical protein
MLQRKRTRKCNSGLTNAVRNLRLFVTTIDQVSRSRSFRQLLTAIAPFIPILLHVLARHYGLQ